MKESRIYWQAKKEVLGQASFSKIPSTNDVLKMLGPNDEKLTGLINNCLQKSTKRIPIEEDPHSEISVYRKKWS